jgi:hypothetical protein
MLQVILAPVKARARVAAALVVLVVPSAAWAQGASVAACIEAHSHGQAERNAGRLQSAKEDFVDCASSSCPSEIKNECVAFLAQVEQSQASIVFAAVDAEGRDATDVRVKVDDQLVLEKLSGLSTPVDPGSHRIVYVWADGVEQAYDVVVAQGEKNRRVELRREATPTATEAAPPKPAPAVKRTPTAAYVLGGVGVLALGSFVAFAISGKSAESEMDGCKPFCTQDQADKMRLRYLLADVSLGVSVVALGAGGYLYFSAKREPASGELSAASVGVRGAF